MVAQTDPVGTAATIEQLGIIGMLALIIIALVMEWVVPGKRLRDSEDQRKRAEETADEAIAGLRVVEDAAKTVVKLVESLPRPDTSREEDRS